MIILKNILSFIVVSLFWGFTNPFIKRGAKGLKIVQKSHKPSDSNLQKLLREYKYLFTNLNYLIPLILNLSGSLVYYYTLGQADLSLAIPITNSLTFAFTALAGVFLGEDFGGKDTIIGILLIIVGVIICVYSKL